MKFVCFNGEMVPSEQPLFTVQNRAFKYGDGVFETIKVFNGEILNKHLHFERLTLNLKLVNLALAPGESQLQDLILSLCEKNDCSHLGRVRLTVYREENNEAGFVIEANPLNPEVNTWNEKGFAIDIYPYARKAKDALSNVKSVNFLPYVLAGMHAAQHQLDDCIVLNPDNHICDTSKANIFLIKENEIFTPALHQGCINGTMRRFLIDGLKAKGYKIYQQEITEQDINEADEVFLTNAIYGMRWVRSFRNKIFTNNTSVAIYRQMLSTIYQ